MTYYAFLTRREFQVRRKSTRCGSLARARRRNSALGALPRISSGFDPTLKAIYIYIYVYTHMYTHTYCSYMY